MALQQEIVIVLSLLLVLGSAQMGVRGPPQAEQKELKKVGRIGENIKLLCPIGGFPTPMVEWSKNGEKIDFMWDRHRTGRKSLKIRNANEDDTGIFTCKGINGFGSEEVRIELIVVDPRTLPTGIEDSDMVDVAPPVFTYDTKSSLRHHVKSVGETFKVSCEALGSPQPEIFWFKDNQHIDESVHYQRGRSTVEFSVMGTADAGVYTCRARNLIGERTLNYTLEVNTPAGTAHAIVTEAGPTNTTVATGETATLQCRVKSIAPPHIKWLKKLEPNDASAETTLRVGHERYRILETNQDESLGNDEYLNMLVIPQATEADAGLYICFVTNSGFGALTYKSMTLRVEERPVVSNNPTSNSDNGEPMAVLIVVICLSVTVGILLIMILSCVVLKKHRKEPSESASNPDVERPFMEPNNHQNFQSNGPIFVAPNNNKANKPLPPTPLILGQWTHSIHPKYAATDSGFADHEISKEFETGVNQYEVPYAHLLQSNSNSRPHNYFTQEAFLQQPNSVVSGFSAIGNDYQPSCPHPSYIGSTVSVSRQKQQQRLPYFSDYDSQ